MKHAKLKAEKRTVLGKQVKKLRRDGFIPTNVYGKNIKSESLQVDTKEFADIYKEVGETGLVDLDIKGELTPVLITNVQKNFRGIVLHADLFQVNLKEKVKAMVPLEVVGEPVAVTEKVGILMNILSEVEVEALPEALPENIPVNVEQLANIDDQITVGELKAPEGVEVLTDPTQVVAKIAELVSKEAQEQAAEEAAAAEAASAEGTTEEGAPQAEGETPAEGQESSKEEEKPQEASE